MTRSEAHEYIRRKLAARSKARDEIDQSADSGDDHVPSQRPVRDMEDVDLGHLPRFRAEEYVPGVMAEPGD